MGDCYMVASGVPRPRADHARALASLALEMRELSGGPSLQHDNRPLLRIGIGTGSVMAGVIGHKKFQSCHLHNSLTVSYPIVAPDLLLATKSKSRMTAQTVRRTVMATRLSDATTSL